METTGNRVALKRNKSYTFFLLVYERDFMENVEFFLSS